MNLQRLEAEVNKLSSVEKASLLKLLINNLDQQEEESIDQDWLNIAEKRAAELDNGTAQGIAAENVLLKARAILKPL